MNELIYSSTIFFIASTEAQDFSEQRDKIAVLQKFSAAFPEQDASDSISLAPFFLPYCSEEEERIAEESILTAIGLYAMYRAGTRLQDTTCTETENSIGYALGLYAAGLEDKSALDAKVKKFTSSRDLDMLRKNTRELIQRLKQSKTFIPVDFASLAVDLYEFQRPELAQKACHRAEVEYRNGILKGRLNRTTDKGHF